MNEKIKQIAEQAGLRFTQRMSNPMVSIVDGKETDLEKFAELIVKECISVLEEQIYQSMDEEGDEIWADVILKEHFGVKE